MYIWILFKLDSGKPAVMLISSKFNGTHNRNSYLARRTKQLKYNKTDVHRSHSNPDAFITKLAATKHIIFLSFTINLRHSGICSTSKVITYRSVWNHPRSVCCGLLSSSEQPAGGGIYMNTLSVIQTITFPIGRCFAVERRTVMHANERSQKIPFLEMSS